jgi:hypothetical protein
MISVAQYFEKRLAIATALFLSGGGMGGFVMPLLMEFLEREFSYQGMLGTFPVTLYHA